MSINFPTDIDVLTNPVAGDRVATVNHAEQHANANDAIEALEAKVGANASAVTTSHAYKLYGVTTGDRAVSLTGSESLTNKTLTSPTITNKSSTGTDSGSETLENKTLNTATANSPVLVTPKITTSINDANGNEVIKTPATASAVNEITVTNSATGNDPLISATGGDTDISLKIKAKGTGKVKLGAVDLQFPNVDGTAGQLLITNGSGVMSWISAEGTPDASETVAGVVEEATDAEVTAGTATGSTGAKLFVTPAKLATNIATKLKFGGTGADGALAITSGATNIDCANAAVVIKNYTSISITGTSSLTFTNPHTNGTIIILKSQGNVTITSSTNPAIDGRLMGASAGNYGTSTIVAPKGGGSGANSAGAGLYTGQNISGKNIKIFAGAGGGNSNAGSGGTGGAGIYIECGGALNITSTINVSGQNGVAGSGNTGGSGFTCPSGGGGGSNTDGITGAAGTAACFGSGTAGTGGGGAGSIVIIYNSLTANSGTYTVTKGNGGAAGGGPAGGNGGDGISLVALNTEFA